MDYCPCRLTISQALGYLGNPLFALPLLDQRQTPIHHAPGRPEGKPLLG
jgi:hypothetical protein